MKAKRVMKPPPLPAPGYDDVTSDEFLYMDDPEWKCGIWAVTREQLARLVKYDNSLLGFKPETPVPILARLFVAYTEIIKRLDFVYGVTFQYQKSQAMRRFLDAATTRLSEIKNALTELDISEYHYLDNELIELKLIPRDLELIPLSAYPIERASQLQELGERLFKGERIYVAPVKDEDEEEEEEDGREAKPKAHRPVVEVVKVDPVYQEMRLAVGMIQRHERARTGRLEFLDEKTVWLRSYRARKIVTNVHTSMHTYIHTNTHNELIELKLIPRDLELIPLSAYPIERASQLQELGERLFKGERIYVAPVKDEDEEEEEEDGREAKPKAHRPVVEVVKVDPVYQEMRLAVGLIQRHERARTGRLEFLDEKTVWLRRQIYVPRKKIPKEVTDQAATKIQKLYRGYLVRREMKKRYYRSRMLLSMDIPSYKSTALQDNLKGFELVKRKKREEKVKEYIDTCLKEKERILRVVGPGLMEDIGDEIRLWFRNWHEVALAFDRYPTEEEGGTIMVIRGDTMTPEEYRVEVERKRVEREKLKGNPLLAAKMKEEANKAKLLAKEIAKKEKARIKREKKEAALRAKRGIVEPFEFKAGPAHKQMKAANELFDIDWTPNDEALAVDDQLVMERINLEKCTEVQYEMRKIVDEMMRLELELLEAAHARDRKKKPDAKKKKKKEKKGKKVKDITANRKVEDLFQEMYDQGIIRPYPETDLDEFIGDYGYKNFDLRQIYENPLPSCGEVKQLVVSNCIIPLGGKNVPKAKSVLIVGPRQCGKKLLVNAICTATSSVMFDLSAKTLAGKYPGKAGMNMLLHLINKMARILQPSVMFIDGAERTFYKKVPKPEKAWEPKKLKSKLFKMIVKTILPDDRVMLIGTTNKPWEAGGPLLKAYEQIIMIPRTDYGTVYQVWVETLMKYHGVKRDFDVSALAKVTVGFPVPYIRQITETVLCPARLIRLKFEPLRHHELLEGLMRGAQPEPVTEKDQLKYTTWYDKKTKMGKLRNKVIGTLKAIRLAEIAAAEKEKSGK